MRSPPVIYQPTPPVPPKFADNGTQSCEDLPLHSEVLLQGRSSLAIDHEGTRYTLRTTRAGKPILTK